MRFRAVSFSILSTIVLASASLPAQGTNSAAFEVFGAGCMGSQGVPRLEPLADSLPWIGSEFVMQISNLPPLPKSAVFGFLGDTDSMFRGASLPLDLSIIGMFGCEMLINARITKFILSEFGVALWKLEVPNDPAFVGGNFTVQAFAFDARANVFGISVSNAGLGTIGAQ
ncbi:MAG: hypothetical protein ACYTG5_04705 [Planctomycetota bacterium]